MVVAVEPRDGRGSWRAPGGGADCSFTVAADAMMATRFSSRSSARAIDASSSATRESAESMAGSTAAWVSTFVTRWSRNFPRDRRPAHA